MIPLDDVRAQVLAAVTALEPHPVALADALGLATAAELVATEQVPPFANTAMDGYAVRAADTADAAADGVRVMQEASPADHVRPAGGDLAGGQAVFPARTVLTPAHLGVLASLSHRELLTY